MYLWSPRWRHQMETFSALLALCAGNSPVTGEFPAQRPVLTGEFPAQRPVTRSYDVFYDLRPNKRLSKQSWADDLRRHRAHYDPRTGPACRNSGVNGPNSNCFTTYDPDNQKHSSPWGHRTVYTRRWDTDSHDWWIHFSGTDSTSMEPPDIIIEIQVENPNRTSVQPNKSAWPPGIFL